MDEVIKTFMLEYDKSSFLIDLVKHKSGNKFVRITQSIDNGTSKDELKINPTVLTDLITILQQLRNEIGNSIIQKSSLYFSDERQKSIIDRYFKGISIEDLALQFECSIEIINQILFNKGIEIVDNKMTKTKRKFSYRRKPK